MSFESAVKFVRDLPKDGPVVLSNDIKLKFYALYKQATEGDNTAAQPWAVQLEARAKWDAWTAVKGKSKEDAEKEYIAALVEATKDSATPFTA